MHISWFGLSSFKITSKDVAVFTDPFGKAAGPTPPRGGGDMIVCSNPSSELYNNYSSISGSPFVIQSPGEYDIKGIFVRGIPAAAAKNSGEKKPEINRQAIYLLTIEGMNVGFLGAFPQKNLTDNQIEELNNIDVLLVPVGGNMVCDAKVAVEIINELEPKIVIPMHYKTSSINVKLDPLDRFTKEMGSKGEAIEKLLVKKTDLEEEKTRLVILEPQRG